MIFLYILLIAAPANVVDVHDGDTLKFKTRDGFELRGRLYGIDCPEVASKDRRHRKNPLKGQPMGNEARDRFRALAGSAVDIESLGKDAYGRDLVKVSRLSDHRLINLILVEEGFCEVYRYKNRSPGPDFEAAEKKAKASKRGIWSLSGYESPGAYRRRTRD